MKPLVRSVSDFAGLADKPTSCDRILMERRLDLFCEAFAKAERACGLRFNDSVSIREHAEAIVKAAKTSKLHPNLYELAWFVRKTCSSTPRD
jgi:hypothetical protein